MKKTPRTPYGNELFRQLWLFKAKTIWSKSIKPHTIGEIFQKHWNRIDTKGFNKCDDLALLLNEVLSSEEMEQSERNPSTSSELDR